MFYEQWLETRKGNPFKVSKAKYLKEFEDYLSTLDINALHLEQYYLDQSFTGWVYTEGNPVFHYFQISKKAELLPHQKFGINRTGTVNNFSYSWKNYPIDNNIRSCYSNLHKFGQVNKNVDLDLPDIYDLFALQCPSSTDIRETLDAIAYANTHKRYVLFSVHPTGPDNVLNWWKYLDACGHLSEYTVLVFGTDTNSLIDNADFVFSASSSITFNALLKDKKTATYRNTPYSEVVPVIQHYSEIDSLSKTSIEDVDRFLSWFYHTQVVDLTNSDWKHKLKEIINDCN